VGHAVGALRASDLSPVGSQRIELPLSQGVCAIVGVGTGLGVGGVVANAGNYNVLATEGGHASFAPTNERSIELLRWLRKKYGRVSAERVLSGAGLANVYQALADADGQHVPELTAAEITARAGSDPLCDEAVGLFCELLGSFAGDLAMTLGAWNGVLISRCSSAACARDSNTRAGSRSRCATCRSKPSCIPTWSCWAPRAC
jgi:glucokinase